MRISCTYKFMYARTIHTIYTLNTNFVFFYRADICFTNVTVHVYEPLHSF